MNTAQQIDEWIAKIRQAMPHVDPSSLGRYRTELRRLNRDTQEGEPIRLPSMALLDKHDAKLKALGKRLRRPNELLGRIHQQLTPSLRGWVKVALGRYGSDPYYAAKAREYDTILTAARPLINQVRDLEAA